MTNDRPRFLVATDDLIMKSRDNKKKAAKQIGLIKGKQYEIVKWDKDIISVRSEILEDHSFSVDPDSVAYYGLFFDR